MRKTAKRGLWVDNFDPCFNCQDRVPKIDAN